MIDRKPGFPEELRKQLHHEVYIAADQVRVEKMIEDESKWREQGFIAITEMEMTPGKRFIFNKNIMQQYKIATDMDGNPFALKPKARSRGIFLNNKIFEHKAYERAKIDGRTHMQGEEVIMVKEV